MIAGVSALKTQLSVINWTWTFFPRIQILIFLRETTQNDHNRLQYKFENDRKKWVVLGVVDMRQLLLIDKIDQNTNFAKLQSDFLVYCIPANSFRSWSALK